MEDGRNIVQVELGELTNSCFVIMPFGGIFNNVYERVIRPAVEGAELVCVRADELFSRPQITHDIWKQIRSCRIVLAEMTGKNPNVLYELGLAHSIGKPAIIITRDEDDVPFDLKALRYLYYNTEDPFWGENLRTSLTAMFQKVVGEEAFGAVFDGITAPENMEISDQQPVKTSLVPAYNLTGVWSGTLEWSSSHDHWNIHLVQTGNVLNGSLVVSFANEGELSVVQQAIVGESDLERVSLQAVSYSYIRKGNSPYYNLDGFNGRISEDGLAIEGEANSKDERVPLIMKRQELDISS